jgi:hypothetical protein
METDRLAKLMRMVLGATTDSERLAALAGFCRAMADAGLDLHDIAERVRVGMANGPDNSMFEGDDRGGWLGGDRAFAMACELARRHSDDLWPDLAQWLVDEDDAWHAGHRRRLLEGRQRRFAEQLAEEAQSVRPSLRRAAWLLVLFDRVSDQRARRSQLRRRRSGCRRRAGPASGRCRRRGREAAAPARPQPYRATALGVHHRRSAPAG